MTNNCEMFHDQPITVNGHTIDNSRSDMCFIDHREAVDRIIEISNPFDALWSNAMKAS